MDIFNTVAGACSILGLLVGLVGLFDSWKGKRRKSKCKKGGEETLNRPN